MHFAGGDPTWTTDGDGNLLIQSASGESLIQSNANMGELGGQFSIEYHMSWNFATAVSGVNREMFLISRTSSGENPMGNQFRFSLTIYSGTSVVNLASQTAGIAGGTNYNNIVPLADLSTDPSGSVFLRVTYSWNQDSTELQAIECHYSTDRGATWMPYDHDLGDAFVPYAITNLGDLRIHTKGDYDEDDYWVVETVVVTGGSYPAATEWAGFPLDQGYADTGGFIGWVLPVNEYVYMVTLNSWAYLPEDYVSIPSGTWMYKYK